MKSDANKIPLRTEDCANKFLTISHDILSFGVLCDRKSFEIRNKELKKYVDHVLYRNEPFSLEVVYTPEVQELMALFP